jgi:hypothetical protein
MKKDLAYVYHIQDPNNLSIEYGYIGIVKASKGIYKRYREHANCKRNMRHHIKENNVTYDDHVKIIFTGTLNECYQKESELRPKQNMGWNLASGGGGPYYGVENISKLRSDIQTKRMQNDDLKKAQGIAFKENYYANEKLQELRKLRSKEHMSDPIKKAKCLSAMHKKIKCPHCDYESNSGNVSQHIRKIHVTS